MRVAWPTGIWPSRVVTCANIQSVLPGTTAKLVALMTPALPLKRKSPCPPLGTRMFRRMVSLVERTKTVDVDPVHLTLGNWAPPSSHPNPVDCQMATGAEASMNAEGVFNVWLCDCPA